MAAFLPYTCDRIEGPQQAITKVEVRKAIKKMRTGKAGGPSGIVSDMLKGGGETVIEEYRPV